LSPERPFWAFETVLFRFVDCAEGGGVCSAPCLNRGGALPAVKRLLRLNSMFFYTQKRRRGLCQQYTTIEPSLQLFDANSSNPFRHRNLEGQHSNSMVAPRILQTFEMHNTRVGDLLHLRCQHDTAREGFNKNGIDPTFYWTLSRQYFKICRCVSVRRDLCWRRSYGRIFLASYQMITRGRRSGGFSQLGEIPSIRMNSLGSGRSGVG
jgi:hypothetical protein